MKPLFALVTVVALGCGGSGSGTDPDGGNGTGICWLGTLAEDERWKRGSHDDGDDEERQSAHGAVLQESCEHRTRTGMTVMLRRTAGKGKTRGGDRLPAGQPDWCPDGTGANVEAADAAHRPYLPRRDGSGVHDEGHREGGPPCVLNDGISSGSFRSIPSDPKPRGSPFGSARLSSPPSRSRSRTDPSRP